MSNLSASQKHDYMMNSLACPRSKRPRVYAKQATRGGWLNYETNWLDDLGQVYLYNRSVIQLTKLGYNIVYNGVNHAKQCFTVTLKDSQGHKLKTSMPLDSITDTDKVTKRKSVRSKKVVCYIDTSVLEQKISITKPKTRKIKL